MIDVVLFRHDFPKQPLTKKFAVILHVQHNFDAGDNLLGSKYIVHTEVQEDNGEPGQINGHYFRRSDDALQCYLDKCKHYMNFYLKPDGWTAMEAELGLV